MRYESPATLDAAVGLLASESGDVKLFAGGTDVMVQIHLDLIEPDLIVDVKNIAEMREVVEENGVWRLGAAVTGKELMDNSAFNAAWPGVMDGVRLIGSVQVRGRATVGGNLCNASPAADSVPPMIAAGAIANVIGPRGQRDIPMAEIVVGPGKTSLANGEIVVSFSLPKRPANSGDAYLRFTPRTEMDIAVVGCGVNLTLDADGTCAAARVSLGAVAARPLLVEAAANALIGTKLDDDAMDALAAAASAACTPIDDKRGTIEYRTEVAGVLAQRAAAIALERAKS
ncbi:MAG: oxidoreductase [Pelagibacteraceae bacterium]|nr:oxidoreductase [Pelagibacteraceae bacterium]PPR10025.1 MAG: Carbon monoxide dehydrogenase medium chain [Alphaproteobacteria bacterium MarineAlpha11_Bin1]|tara:strand:- start:1931 stop:2788 length:858 start_codon:yes stop_codon:yes gene_type:complete